MIHFDRSFNMTIEGVAAEGNGEFDVVDPATETVIARVPDCSAAQLDAAVAAARRAFPAWSATPLETRSRAVLALADAIEREIEPLARLLTLEQGKPVGDARGEILGTIARLRNFAGFTIPVEVMEDTPQRRVEMHRVPIGVVAALAPWNFPVMLGFMKAASALMTGNTVVLKPSPFTPLATLKIGELARDLLPAGVLNVVSGGDALGPMLTAHDGIDKISFTGSSRTGRKVMESAASTLKRVTLELGGNDAAIVLEDADVETIAPQIFWSAFRNVGQVCIAAKRVYAHAAIYDRLRDALVAYGRTVHVGSGLEQGVEIGPIQNRQQFDHVTRLVDESRQKDMVLLGGEPVDGPGYFMRPTFVDNPPADARIVLEEQFGPLLPLLRFDDLDWVVDQVNATPYGLGGTIWTGDEARGRALAARIDTGSIWINSAPSPAANAPFGGRRQSGIGVEGGYEGLLAYTEVKMLYVTPAQP